MNRGLHAFARLGPSVYSRRSSGFRPPGDFWPYQQIDAGEVLVVAPVG